MQSMTTAITGIVSWITLLKISENTTPIKVWRYYRSVNRDWKTSENLSILIWRRLRSPLSPLVSLIEKNCSHNITLHASLNVVFELSFTRYAGAGRVHCVFWPSAILKIIDNKPQIIRHKQNALSGYQIFTDKKKCDAPVPQDISLFLQ